MLHILIETKILSEIGYPKLEEFFSLTYITFAEQLHAHDGKYENDNAQHESKVSQSSDGFTHDWYKQV